MKKGIIASEGIGIGKTLVIEHVEFNLDRRAIINVEEELLKLDDAINKTVEELQVIAQNVLNNIGASEAEIFQAHQMMAQDVEIIGQAKQMIKDELVCCEYAYDQVTKMFISMFESMDDAYMKERALDIYDVSKRVLGHILNVKSVDLANINEDSIIVAMDLTPSETSQLNAKYVKAFITMVGGKTSHSAIIARTLEIPAIAGLNEELSAFTNGQTIIVDALNNNIIVDATEELVNEYTVKLNEYNDHKALWLEYLDKKAFTIDGKTTDVAANIGSVNDLEGALAVNADGIGLFRTEFLFMESTDFPSEEVQYDSYKKVLNAFPNNKVVIRTLDIGGDKHLEYFTMDEEMNPFLGVRAIRLCFANIEMFKAQLRALLRANEHGNLCIMFPMIAVVEEFTRAKDLVIECHKELEQEGIKVNPKYQVGMMVEIPAAAVSASEFAPIVDFFSIGTNDLIQYTMAADRMNQSLNYLYQPLNPAIKWMIKNVVDCAHKEGKWAGMCGEMAGDSQALEFLMTTGIDELSMSARSVLKTRYDIAKMDTTKL